MCLDACTAEVCVEILDASMDVLIRTNMLSRLRFRSCRGAGGGYVSGPSINQLSKNLNFDLLFEKIGPAKNGSRIGWPANVKYARIDLE